MGDCRPTLDAAVFHWSVKTADEQHHVDVGGKLLFAIAVGVSPAQQRAAGENCHCFVIDNRDPVADGRCGVKTLGEHDCFYGLGKSEDQTDAVVEKHPSR